MFAKCRHLRPGGIGERNICRFRCNVFLDPRPETSKSVVVLARIGVGSCVFNLPTVLASPKINHPSR